jgi:hypothetical protein
MRPEQRQQQRDFFLRTDLNHVCLLFASLVGSNGGGVQDDLVSGLFQDCFVVMDKAVPALRVTCPLRDQAPTPNMRPALSKPAMPQNKHTQTEALAPGRREEWLRRP